MSSGTAVSASEEFSDVTAVSISHVYDGLCGDTREGRARLAFPTLRLGYNSSKRVVIVYTTTSLEVLTERPREHRTLG